MTQPFLMQLTGLLSRLTACVTTMTVFFEQTVDLLGKSVDIAQILFGLCFQLFVGGIDCSITVSSTDLRSVGLLVGFCELFTESPLFFLIRHDNLSFGA